MRAQEAVETVLGTLEAVRTIYEQNREGIRRAEAITWDLLHEIELGTHTGPQRMSLYRRLRENLQERRAMKNENEALEPLYRKLAGNKSLEQLKIDLFKARSEITAVLETQSNRVYTPRVLTDLTIGGINQCYEN